ncbi:lactoylglutathione lyase [Bacillus manliponensis]|uniref:lactoylglutathione lyase n=1 Tax=Bacillus manliponensis TaxID=574376 RepID=UPI000AA32D1F
MEEINLHISNLKETLYFYEGILGFQPSKQRPQLHVPGVWYDVGQVRLCCVVNKMRKKRDIKVKLSSAEIEKVKKKLDYYKVGYVERETALFLYDPDEHSLQLQLLS